MEKKILEGCDGDDYKKYNFNIRSIFNTTYIIFLYQACILYT